MYEMKPEYYIGIDMIDEEHKQLFEYADEAYELLHDEFTPDKYDKIDIILENLRNYTVKHFSDEEQYMESINYKKLFTQKIQHQEFIQKLDEFMEHHNDDAEDQDGDHRHYGQRGGQVAAFVGIVCEYGQHERRGQGKQQNSSGRIHDAVQHIPVQRERRREQQPHDRQPATDRGQRLLP